MYDRTRLLCELTGMTVPMLALALGRARHTADGWAVPLCEAAQIADTLELTAEQRAELAASYGPRTEWERLRFSRFLTLRQAAKLAGVTPQMASLYEAGRAEGSTGWQRYRAALGAE